MKRLLLALALSGLAMPSAQSIAAESIAAESIAAESIAAESIAASPVGVVPFAIVSTTRPPSIRTVRDVGGYLQRFSYVAGSGALVVDRGEVIGYYFTAGDLAARTAYTYTLHRSLSSGRPTSCEGAKNLNDREAAGEVLRDLDAIAPFVTSDRGVAFVGSEAAPIALPQPIPLASIGYIYFQATSEAALNSDEFCANIRLDPGGFERE